MTSATATPTPPPVTEPPVAITNPATLIAGFSAKLNGSVNPHGLTTSVYFQYGTTTGYGLTTVPQSQTGNTSLNISANISGLTASTTYRFRSRWPSWEYYLSFSNCSYQQFGHQVRQRQNLYHAVATSDNHESGILRRSIDRL